MSALLAATRQISEAEYDQALYIILGACVVATLACACTPAMRRWRRVGRHFAGGDGRIRRRPPSGVAGDGVLTRPSRFVPRDPSALPSDRAAAAVDGTGLAPACQVGSGKDAPASALPERYLSVAQSRVVPTQQRAGDARYEPSHVGSSGSAPPLGAHSPGHRGGASSTSAWRDDASVGWGIDVEAEGHLADVRRGRVLRQENPATSPTDLARSTAAKSLSPQPGQAHQLSPRATARATPYTPEPRHTLCDETVTGFYDSRRS